jgi:uncharacterized membrane protein
MTTHPGRFPELDAVRGLAVVMMILYHLFVDLSFLGISGPDPFSGPLKVFGLATASLFILVAGVSAHIKAERTINNRRWYLSFLKRGMELIFIGFGITLVTYWFLNGEGYVLFGILHLIGLSLLLTPFFYRLGRYNIIPVVCIFLYSWFFILPFGPLWMVPTGIHPAEFVSVDYTPVIPWMSVFLIGFLSGGFLFPYGNHRWDLKIKAEKIRYFLPFIITGRHSLIIYLVHQPLLVLILMLLFNKF